MSDITLTPVLYSLSYTNLVVPYANEESIWSNAFFKTDANYQSKCNAQLDLYPKNQIRGVNLFFVPDLEKVFVYEWLKLDKTVVDITITTIDEHMITSINNQLDNTDIRVKPLQLNKYEFILLFYIDCDYITDINLILDQDTDNEFIRSFVISKLRISEMSIAFKFFHKFR